MYAAGILRKILKQAKKEIFLESIPYSYKNILYSDKCYNINTDFLDGLIGNYHYPPTPLPRNLLSVE